ncbi:MAG TPA: hypothetical protein VG841_05710 [Caulobacterales bacterium]|nr:hypothetical protein [Caulobacterales bacterium]
MADVEPDLPCPFGYKISWLAARADTIAVATAFELEDLRTSNWAAGVAAANSPRTVFITPAVRGWTFVVSGGLPEADARVDPSQHRNAAEGVRRFKRFELMMETLSNALGEVQYFGTHRVVEYHAWAKFNKGELVRMFAFLGESGEVVANLGDVTSEERAIGLADVSGLSLTDATDAVFESEELPNEEWVTTLAGSWSVNPTQLDCIEATPDVGAVGLLPRKYLDSR